MTDHRFGRADSQRNLTPFAVAAAFEKVLSLWNRLSGLPTFGGLYQPISGVAKLVRCPTSGCVSRLGEWADTTSSSVSIKTRFILIVLILFSGLGGLHGPAYGSTSAQVWSDRLTGLAIAGYDPIAYFTDGRARLGTAEYEFAWRGVTWRFSNSGNMAVFKSHPSIYAPQFGGYDALGVARGVTGPGNPQIWIIENAKLYLFFSLDDKKAWQKQSKSWISTGARNWPALSRTLSN